MNKRYHEKLRIYNEESILEKLKRVCMNMIHSIVKFVTDTWQKIMTKIRKLKERFKSNPRMQALLNRINNNKITQALNIAKKNKRNVEMCDNVNDVEYIKNELEKAKNLEKDELEKAETIFRDAKVSICLAMERGDTNYLRKILNDPSFNSLWKPHRSFEPDRPESEWDYNYYGLVQSDFMENPSKQRLQHIIQIANKLKA